jgi:hypothetical protein
VTLRKKAGSRVTHPAPQKTATTSSHKMAQDDDERGFFHNAMSGKVRPGAREPQNTHSCCSCCRWSA